MKKNFKHTAFSLIEVSLVLLIVGVIITGMMQSSRLVSAFRMQTAKNLVQNSPVWSTQKVVMWLETTLDKSFLESEGENGLAISIWKDISGYNTVRNNATQDDDQYKPVYLTNCINYLPCLRFNNSKMYYDGSVLANTDYTVIVVEQRRSADSENYFMAGEDAERNTNLTLGYRDDDHVTFAQYDNDYDISVSGYSSPAPVIHVFTFNGTEKKYYRNGSDMTLVAISDADMSENLKSYNSAKLGNYLSSYYNGDLAEVILIADSLKTKERQNIERYLARKWKVAISS